MTEQRFTPERTNGAFPDSAWGIFDWEKCRWVTELVEVGQLGITDLPKGTVKRIRETWPTKAHAAYRAAELNG